MSLCFLCLPFSALLFSSQVLVGCKTTDFGVKYAALCCIESCYILFGSRRDHERTLPCGKTMLLACTGMGVRLVRQRNMVHVVWVFTLFRKKNLVHVSIDEKTWEMLIQTRSTQ